MTHPVFKNSPPFVKLILTAIVVLGSWLFFQLLAILTGMLFYSVAFEELLSTLSNLDDPSGLAFLKYVQAVTSFGLFIFSSFLIAMLLDDQVFRFLYLRKYPRGSIYILVGIIMVVVLPFSNLMTELNKQLVLPESLGGLQNFIEQKESQMEEVVRSFLKVQGLRALLVNLLIIAVIPAIGEELLFRGVFQRLFTQLTRNPHAGILITAFIFSALHLQFLSFLPRFALGALFGYMVFWSGSLWPAILAHFINNGLAVIYYHIYYAGKTDIDLEKIGSSDNALFLGIISMVVTVILLYVFKKRFKEKPVLVQFENQREF